MRQRGGAIAWVLAGALSSVRWMRERLWPRLPVPGRSAVGRGRREDRIVMVAAYATNRVIGDRGRIPWHIPEDFAHFKEVTLGHTLVMGRATWDSIGRPLPGRSTVVLTRDETWSPGEWHGSVFVAHTLDEALEIAAGLPGDTMIAGGTEVYRQALPVATHQVLTEVQQSPAGDAHYPEFSQLEWRETRRVARPDLDPPLEWVWWERVARGCHQAERRVRGSAAARRQRAPVWTVRSDRSGPLGVAGRDSAHTWSWVTE